MKALKHPGICKICGQMKELTAEHIPPKNAFNSTNVMVLPWKSSKVNITAPFPINAIGTQDSCDVECVFSEASFLEGNTYCCRLSLQYEDLLGYSYEQDFIFEFGDVEGTDGLVKCETCAPEYLGKIYYRLNKETNHIERVLEK